MLLTTELGSVLKSKNKKIVTEGPTTTIIRQERETDSGGGLRLWSSGEWTLVLEMRAGECSTQPVSGGSELPVNDASGNWTPISGLLKAPAHTYKHIKNKKSYKER